MSVTINPELYSGAYYQLPGNTTLQAAGAVQPSSGGIADTSGGDSSMPADLVDLSQQAQNFLAGIGGGNNNTTPAGNGFILNSADQKKIDDILAKYKDAPFTQDTYNKIQDDLKAAGLSPDLLAAKDMARNLNPTSILLNALNGDDNSFNFSDMFNPESEQANANQFMQQIMQKWQSISTTAGAADTTDAGAGSTA